MARERAGIEGYEELNETLKSLGKSMTKGVLRRVLLKAGAPIQETAQRLAPQRPADAPPAYYKDGGGQKLRRPGTTKILVQIGTRLTKRQASAARKAGKALQEVYVGTRDRVARLVEFGTSHSRPQPFMRTAWDQHQREALEIIKRELRIEIDKAVARKARREARAAAAAAAAGGGGE